MALYDVYGLGNALVDMEFEVTDSFLQQMKIEKGLMTLVNEARQREIIEIHGMQHKRTAGSPPIRSSPYLNWVDVPL